MAPRTRKAVAKRRLNRVSQGGDEVEEHPQQQNEQQPDVEVSRESIQKQDGHCGFRDKQPQIFPQASREQETGPRTLPATGNLSGCLNLLDKNQMEGVGQHQNEEELELQTTQQTNGRPVTAPRTQRSNPKRILNHGLLDENEMEVHGQHGNEQHSNLEVAEALQNALNILMTSSTRRAATHCGFQEREENGQQQNRQQLRPSISQQVSMMTPTIRKATRSHLGHHRLQNESQMEGEGHHQNEEQPDFQMTPQVLTPSTQRSMAKRKLNHVLLDEDEIEEHGQQENEDTDLEVTQKIAKALKILMAPTSRRATINLNSHNGFRDKDQMKENGQLQNRQELQPQISHQASMMAPRPRKATTNQSGYHRLRGEDQMERDREHQNEEQPEFQSPLQTKGQPVMTPSTRRSTAGRKVNHGLLDEDEIEEHGHQENEQASDLDVTQAIENALKILMDPSTQRATTNVNSVLGLQDKHQMNEIMQQQSGQQQRPLVSQQASISTVMPPRTQNETRSQREHHTLQDEGPMEGDGLHQNEEPPEVQITQQTNVKKGTMKRKRGPTLLREIWGRHSNDERIVVDFNKRGQPVGPNKKTFVGFLGTIARNGKYAPLDIEDWRKVPKENKDEMIKLVKERFEVPEGAEHWILLSIGKKRNSWKSRVKTQCFAPALSTENQALKPPARVNDDQWKNLLSYWDNEDVMEVCERNRVHGRQSVMYQTTGKMSYAEIEEELRERLGRSPTRVEMFAACFTHRDGNPSTHEVGVALARMRECQSKLPDGSQDPVGPNDTFAKVIGNDPPGKVRMLGLGVNQSDLWGGTPNLSTCYQMVLENQGAMARMEEKMDQFTKFMESLQERMQPQQNLNNVPTTRRPTSPGQSSNSNIVGHKLQVGDSVLLKSLFDHNKIVAKGCLESVSPDQYVGGRRLGANWYAVQISVPIEWDEDLIRPYSNFSTIGDAIGNCVSWPHNLVVYEDIQE